MCNMQVMIENFASNGDSHSEERKLPINWEETERIPIPIPQNEGERVATLAKYNILYTPPERVFDDITQLAAYICNTPIAMISLVAPHKQWFKSKIGLSINETRRDLSFCTHAIMGRELFIVRDALQDPRFAKNPFVVSDPKIRFYAAVPLVAPNDCAIGTLCVIDRIPRDLTPDQKEAMQALGRVVMTILEMRKKLLGTK